MKKQIFTGKKLFGGIVKKANFFGKKSVIRYMSSLGHALFSGPVFPTTVIISPTNRCNLSCLPCARNIWDGDKNPPGDLPQEFLGPLYFLLKTAKIAVLHGSGEPLLSAAFPRLALLAKRANCRTLFHTNGTLIDEKMAHLIIETGIDEIRPSLDFASDDKQRLQRGCGLDEIIENMARIRTVAQKKSVIGPAIVPAFISSQSSVSQLPDMVNLVSKLKYDGLFVGRINPRKGLYHPENEEEEHYFYLAGKLAARSGIRLYLPPSRNCIPGPCPRPFDTLAFLHDGTIRSCSYGLWHGSGVPDLGKLTKPCAKRDFTLLNLKELFSSWYGVPARGLRKAHLMGYFPKACLNCSARPGYFAREKVFET